MKWNQNEEFSFFYSSSSLSPHNSMLWSSRLRFRSSMVFRMSCLLCCIVKSLSELAFALLPPPPPPPLPLPLSVVCEWWWPLVYSKLCAARSDCWCCCCCRSRRKFEIFCSNAFLGISVDHSQLKLTGKLARKVQKVNVPDSMSRLFCNRSSVFSE